MNTQIVQGLATRIEVADALVALMVTDTVKDSKIVYQWQTARRAVAMEFDDEARAREWHDKRMKQPNADSMPQLELFKVETTNITTKL